MQLHRNGNIITTSLRDKILGKICKIQYSLVREAFNILEEVKDRLKKKDCCLVFDTMTIRKQAFWNPMKNLYVSFVNYGDILLELPDILQSEALGGLCSHWKCPFAYVLIDNLFTTNPA